MTNQFNQLRFDISEKVRLHPQQIGIGSLLELDLYPDVEIKDEGQHLKIEGYLRLNGSYLGNEQERLELHTERQSETQYDIAYVIPVEITLPADKAILKHVSAEVETFDYTVISPFELQIEAILMIDGLIPESSDHSDREEEMLLTSNQDPLFKGAPAEPSDDMQTEEQEETVPFTVEKMENHENAEKEDERVGHSESEVEVEEDQEIFQNRNEDQPIQVEIDDSQEGEPAPPKSFIPQEPHAFWEDRQNFRHERQMPHREDQTQHVGAELEAEIEVESDLENETMSEQESKHDWIQWLLREDGEDFARMKMVIAQKDETVQEVAERYGLLSQEIIKLNQLQSEELENGQIIKIPKNTRENISS
ncbi:LysM peptidoglycan-binding domain-containing protein [Hazenella sp. IB182353]|uniref:LysM peptidoglycan-binding domain-containing protein n=1 Tax=Polycladospora coralii TaxID=2771432 RepID=UPI0017475611|nr:LysM peptidoglycan-binding domain-containing protein [Polycladospora coralii]MBS7529255.1 LysM peptidoglycan-binding domain-containing protein [Polycladospora coralii]